MARSSITESWMFTKGMVIGYSDGPGFGRVLLLIERDKPVDDKNVTRVSWFGRAFQQSHWDGTGMKHTHI